MTTETRRRGLGAPWNAAKMIPTKLRNMYLTNVSSLDRSTFMSWSKPAYTDLRIGFEVTMYFANR
ncbi:coenzyme PQQ precursor peptide PqqA [Pseudomonas lini]|jgi:pyrroloquinoline quinone biosynthesis protein A|uniref:Coenzyme PQQ synthesis protein A n=3 Tax=Pseudomonas TaxID=286 RepID=A0A1H1Z1T3_9PSED|nr:coenzyme PQQ precursor peptide PqqA [Pseudomonas lini]